MNAEKKKKFTWYLMKSVREKFSVINKSSNRAKREQGPRKAYVKAIEKLVAYASSIPQRS